MSYATCSACRSVAAAAAVLWPEVPAGMWSCEAHDGSHPILVLSVPAQGVE